MKKKLQVFVSSTYTDMLPERQAAVEAILRAGHIPAGMELFAAGNASQLETIRRWIDDSDVFMLMLGGRYGSIEPNSGKSYVELEYDYAAQQGKPLFAAVIAERYLDQKVKDVGSAAIERDNGHLLKAFRDKVTQKICRFFNDMNELKLIVFESIANFDQNETLAGWIRGTDVIDPKATLDEIARLRGENESLSEQVRELSVIIQTDDGSVGANSSLSALTDDAKVLLVAATADGSISYLRFMGGASIQAGGKSFNKPQNDRREEARWKAAIEELVANGLAEQAGSRGETFRITKRGYDVADSIQAKK